jgi:protein subunit release factor B
MKFRTDLRSLERKTRVYFYRSRGPGGQRKNKKETAVRLYHEPSGVTVTASELRYQSKNKERAFKRLQAKLNELNRKKRPRIPTRLPRALKEKILKAKKLRSAQKKLRKSVEIPSE